jgi:hypothetical protein
MKILFELCIGVLLWIVVSTGRKVIQATAHRSSKLQRILSVLPAITIIAWYVYGLWLLQRRFSGNSLYPIVILLYFVIPSLLVAWFILRDIFAGAVFSGRKQFHLNHHIQCGGLSGRIIAKGMTHLAVQTDNGETARIPYSRLSGEIVTERSEDTESDYYRIHLTVPGKRSSQLLQADLIRDVRATPWASTATPPVVQLRKQTDTSCEFEVLFRSLNSRHAGFVERLLRDAYEN